MAAIIEPAIVSHQEVLDAMERYGGHFMSNLAKAWRRADSANHARLFNAFGDDYASFKRTAEQDKSRILNRVK